MNITLDKIMRNNKFYNDISDILISQNRIFQVPIQNFLIYCQDSRALFKL